MHLYSLRTTSTPDTFRVTKFTLDLEVESSYLISAEGCECPGYSGRGRCRHETILHHIVDAGRVDTSWFLEFDDRPHGWRQYVGDQAPKIAANEGIAPSPTPASTPTTPAAPTEPGLIRRRPIR